MPEITWFAQYPVDYQRDTSHLSMIEDGAYRRLLDAYYMNGGALEANVKQLLRICRAITGAERSAIVKILNEFFTLSHGKYYQARAEHELKRMAEISAKRAAAGRKGGSKKQALAKQLLTHLPLQSSTNVEDFTPTGSSDEGSDLLGHDVSNPNGKTNGHHPIKRQAEFPTEDDLQEAVEHWNIKAAQFGLPQIEKLTDKRRSHLRARLRELGELGAWFGTINGMIDMPFLLGKVKDWKADFDWVINESNFRKIDEGKYRR